MFCDLFAIVDTVEGYLDIIFFPGIKWKKGGIIGFWEEWKLILFYLWCKHVWILGN